MIEHNSHHPTVGEFETIKKEALARLPAIGGMSDIAVRETFPDLIKQAHFETIEIEQDGETQSETVFTLWTSKGHAMTSDGRIVHRVAKENTEIFITVDDKDLDGDLMRTLGKTLRSLPQPLYERSNTERGKWIEKKT